MIISGLYGDTVRNYSDLSSGHYGPLGGTTRQQHDRLLLDALNSWRLLPRQHLGFRNTGIAFHFIPPKPAGKSHGLGIGACKVYLEGRGTY